MRKLKKALSLVLAIALVLGLCTIGAAAIETPNGEYEDGGTIEYHVTANDLSKLLAVKDYGADAEVDKVTLNFNEDIYVLGPDSLDMLWNAAADTYNYVFSNLSKVQPDCIKSLTVDLADGRTVEVDSDELTANYIGTGSHIYELSLTEADETYLVTFWAQQGNDLHWTRYSVVAVEKGGTVGNKMPADPDTGNYVFIGWELGSHDGSGSKFTADIAVNSDIVVYARKVSVGGGSAYHVMNPDTELNAYAAAELGAASAEAVTIDSVRVNGQDEEATNPSYTTNGWEAHNGVSYFYIYNEDAYAASFDPQYNNTRVPASEVTSITLFCTLNGEKKEVNIGIDELELAVVSDVIIEIRLHKSGDGDFIITASAGENGSISPVGNVSVAAGADQSFSFLPGDGFTVDTLTVNNTTTYENNGSGSFDLTGYTFSNVQANGSIHVTFAADANDNDIPDYKEKKYGVTYEFVSGTDGKVLPGSGMPALPSDNSIYLIGITVTNKGESTYEAVSVDDGTWAFTGWDANEKVMSKDGITFTGTWTFTPNEPEPSKYTIYYHANGGTTANGSEQSTSTFAYGSNATIKNNPFTYTGYVFEGWSLSAESTDVVYQGGESVVFNDTTFPGLTANGRVDLYAKWALDEKGGGDDGESPDGIPDYKQLFVKYTSADSSLGSVSPACETFTLEVDESGKVLTDPVTLSGAATTGENAQFAYWTITGLGYEGGAYSYDADLESKAFSGYVAGKTYTFTAYFTEDIVKPEPETYTIKVEVINGTAEFMDTNIGAYNEIVAAADEDITIAFTPDEGYEFDYVYVDGVWSEIGADGKYTFENVSSDHSIKVAYKQESVPATPIIPLPTENDIAKLIDSKFIVDCVNDDVNHASKNYGLVDDALVNVAMTDSTTVKVTLSTNAYLAQYNYDDTSTKHSLADGQSETVTITLKYVDDGWTLPADAGELPATIKVVCATPAAPKAPTEDELKALFDGKVNVECVNSEAAHAAKRYGYEKAGFTVGEVMDAGTSYTVKVTIDAAYYQAKYNTDIAAKHNLASGQSTKVTVELRYDNGWKLNEAAPTIKVVCDTPAAPNAPTENELKALFDGKVFVDCVEKSWHPTYAYGLLADGYTVAGPVKGADGEYTCTVTLLASAYLAEYNDDVTDKHTLASYQGDETVALKWTGSAWTVINGELPVTFDVVCDTWYPPYIPPVEPEEPVYEPNWLNTTDHFGYIIGYEDGTIKPDASITRAEVATIFFRLLTDEARDKFWTETNSYSDVAETAWYNNAVSTLSRMGILGGYEDGSFRPNASITRAEFAKIAVSFFEYEDISAENIFTDVAAGSWYENFVAVAAKLGLIEGYAGNVYRPNESITRAEACTIINRTLGRAPDADHLLPESEMNTWPDNRPGVWYYAQLQEATNSHEYKWSGDIEHWTAKLPERDWDALQR